MSDTRTPPRTPAGIDVAATDPRSVLEAKLLAIGGQRVVWREPDPERGELAARGALMAGPVRRRRGRQSQCHMNAAASWAEDVERYAVCTGYALSADGLWRQHSWVRDADGGLIETTEPRTHYFGIALTQAAAAEFWGQNFLFLRYRKPFELFAAAAADRPRGDSLPP